MENSLFRRKHLRWSIERRWKLQLTACHTSHYPIIGVKSRFELKLNAFTSTSAEIFLNMTREFLWQLDIVQSQSFHFCEIFSFNGQCQHPQKDLVQMINVVGRHKDYKLPANSWHLWRLMVNDSARLKAAWKRKQKQKTKLIRSQHHLHDVQDATQTENCVSCKQ